MRPAVDDGLAIFGDPTCPDCGSELMSTSVEFDPLAAPSIEGCQYSAVADRADLVAKV